MKLLVGCGGVVSTSSSVNFVSALKFGDVKQHMACANMTSSIKPEVPKGGNVTSAGWQVTLCDPMWHVSYRSGVATLQTAIHLLLVTYLTYQKYVCLSLRDRMSGTTNQIFTKFWAE